MLQMSKQQIPPSVEGTGTAIRQAARSLGASGASLLGLSLACDRDRQDGAHAGRAAWTGETHRESRVESRRDASR